jgi:GNAT superfamily N-acetyltransferase
MFKIRPATENDVSLILRLIHELAEFEKLSHEVVATEQSLAESLFGSTRRAEALIGEENGTPVSFALFFHNFSTFLGHSGIYLEDLYVTPAARGKGYGKTLLSQIAKIAVERNCGRCEWSVLDWNKNAIQMYKKLGAVPMDEWTVYRLTGSALQELAESSKN